MAKMQNAVVSDWADLSMDALSPEARRAYDAYKAAYKQAKAARETFEGLARQAIPIKPGYRLAFAYNFGKLRVAVVEAKVEEPKGTASRGTLADWLATQ